MSDEEKKAIEVIKGLAVYYDDYSLLDEEEIEENEEVNNSINIVINLIEKQFKEIEELKKPKYIIDFKTNKITTLTNDFVSKDKIKAKIEVLEKLQKEFPNNDEIRIKIIAYKELLEKE